MRRVAQPQYKIRVYNGKDFNVDMLKGSVYKDFTNKNYIDIEQCTVFPVVYEEQASLLNTLNFTVGRYADLLLYYFYIGQHVMLYGGDYVDDVGSMRLVFSGTVTRIRTKFSDSGVVTFNVECMNYGYTKLGKNLKNYVYPDKNSSRKFATGETLTLEQLFRGIAKENNYAIGTVDLSVDQKTKLNYNIDKIHVQYQKNETDWAFLCRVAKSYGCTVWVSLENGEEKLNLASYKKAFENQSKDIGFLFPLYGRITDVQDSEIIYNKDTALRRPRILRDVTVEEDISQAYAVSRSAVYFDKTTGEEKDAVSRITTDKDGNRVIVFYELDEARVAYISRTDPELAKSIRDNGPTSMEWGDDPNNPKYACYYYKEIKVYDEHVAVFDRAFFGITVTAKCNQDLNIRSQRTYRLRGILSYHSKSLETSFFLRGLKHTWDSDGTWTELDFIR